jgi:hypothetical protein
MKISNNIPTLHVAFIITTAIFNHTGNAERVHGEMMINPYFEGNYDHWDFSGDWRNDNIQNRIVYEVSQNNVGYPAAVGRAKKLSLNLLNSDSPHTDSAILTSFIFNPPYISVYGSDLVGAEASYSLYFEIDILTASSMYRAKSQEFNQPWNLPQGDLHLDFKWLKNQDFPGNPFERPEGGMPIETIQEVYYKAIIKVMNSNHIDSKTAYITLDNMSLTYEIEID